ncbi:MAG: hypothetical protein EZS28_017406 [Streblomastix strix]|uniref:Uncharacterized protein n=1 Tax=Streblomastix strix TaxID=222440 RepID=A0A5J4VWQ1_9EUKA|nr:MAG: hypothetical protein EZS28_017406 [Streblomastix strix]
MSFFVEAKIRPLPGQEPAQMVDAFSTAAEVTNYPLIPLEQIETIFFIGLRQIILAIIIINTSNYIIFINIYF